MKKVIKKIIILYAIREIKKMRNKNYAELGEYGIEDIMKHSLTKEDMYIFNPNLR